MFMGIGWKLHQAAPGVDQWNIRVKDFISMLYVSLPFQPFLQSKW